MIIHNFQIVSAITDNDFIQYGYGGFTTIPRQLSEPLLKLHFVRLKKTAVFLEFDFKLTYDEFEKLIAEEQVKLTDNQCLKFIVTKSGWFLQKRNFQKRKQIKLAISDYNYLKNDQYLQYKTGNYLINMHQLQLAKNNGFMDMLFLNEDGYVCETTIANIFWIKDNQLYTPSVKCGLLNGTIRQAIINNFAVVEHEEATIDLLDRADVVFTTNALNNVVLVQNIGNAEQNDQLFQMVQSFFTKGE